MKGKKTYLVVYPGILWYTLTTPVTVKVKKEVLWLAEKMVELGLAKTRSQAINIMIEKGIMEVTAEVRFWEKVERSAERMVKSGYKLSHGGLTALLAEDRQER